MTAQRLLVESGNKNVAKELFDIIKNFEVDEIGLNSPAVHALWTLHGLGLLDGENEEALQVAFQALRHPAAGVRKAAVEVLPKTEASVLAIRGNDVLQDENLNVRMHAFLALAEMPSSAAVGEMLYEASMAPENAKDDWVTKAIFAAATQHEESFLTASAKGSATAGSLTARLVEAVSREFYELGRRSTLQFSPDVSNKEIIISTSVAQRGDQAAKGLIVAHGNKTDGYALFVEDGKVKFLVNQNGKSYEATTSKALSERFDVVAQLGKNGQMTLQIDGSEAARAKAPGLFTVSLEPSVRSGRDFGDQSNVGKYEGENAFEGNFQDLILELK